MLKKIAFRHVPFDADQRAKLDEIAKAAGYETLWCGAEMPTVEDLYDCECLLGYFPPDMMKELPNLKWLQTPAAGVEKLCGDIYANPDVVLCNCSGVFGTDISEYMICGMLMIMRHMKGYVGNMRDHKWDNLGVGRAIYGSTACVIGCGNIGQNVAARLKALGAACVRGLDRTNVAPTADFDEMYANEDFEKALAGADIVTASLPNTPATRELISAAHFDAMKDGAVFVNAGRGLTVDQKALTANLASGKLAGAVLDVFQVEPLPEDDPLWDLDNVVVTPHVAGWDDDPVNILSMFQIFEDNLNRWIAGDPLTHVVDRARGF